jgi:hypothetical protein
MNKYRLTPINPEDHCWKYSDTTEPLIVEAKDEESARSKISAKHYYMAEEGCAGEDNPNDPWDDPEKCQCELIAD